MECFRLLRVSVALHFSTKRVLVAPLFLLNKSKYTLYRSFSQSDIGVSKSNNSITKSSNVYSKESVTQQSASADDALGFLSINDTTHNTTEVGSQLFRELVIDSTVFVDKSLFLKEFLTRTKRYALITYPRRWGKSMNLDMVKTFVEIEVDKNGNLVPSRENDKLFIGGKVHRNDETVKTLPPLEISHHTNVIQNFMGKYPVIYLNMQNIFSPTYDGIIDRYRFAIMHLFNQHKYLLNSKHLDTEDMELFKKYKNGIAKKETELQDAVYILSRFLNLHFNKKVFILIDEYDAVINQAFIKMDDNTIVDVVDLIGRIFQTTLKGNNYVERALITGVYRIAKSAFFSELNNFVEIGILDKKFAPYYGFTEVEVNKLLAVYAVPSTISNGIKAWYNGYNIGNYQIYNPWSIVNVLSAYESEKKSANEIEIKHQILKSYHEIPKTIGYLDNLFKFPEIRSIISDLVLGHSLDTELSTSFSIDEYKVIKQVLLIGSDVKITDALVDSIFSYLFAAGYLTPCPVDKVHNINVKTSNHFHFQLPNNEIRFLLARKILNYYSVNYNIKRNLFTNITDILQKFLNSPHPAQSLAEFEKEFTQKLNELFSTFPELAKLHKEGVVSRRKSKDDTIPIFHGNEALLQMVIGYIAIQLTSMNNFGLEVNLGTGRTDVTFTDIRNNKAVIIELKYNTSANVAIQQIKDKQYAVELSSKYPVIIIGINLRPTKIVDVMTKLIPFQGEKI